MDNKIIIQDVQKVLREKFKEKISRVILFGSRSRGDYNDFSDYDILIILKNDFDWRFEREISSALLDIDLKYDIIIDFRVISENEMKTIKGKQPFILNAMAEGTEA